MRGMLSVVYVQAQRQPIRNAHHPNESYDSSNASNFGPGPWMFALFQLDTHIVVASEPYIMLQFDP